MTIGLGPNGTGKLRLVRPGVLLHWCPACNKGHTVDIHALNQDGHVIGWDGDYTAPTFGQPLRHAVAAEQGAVCEYLLRGGVLHYTGACTHAMRGRAVPLQEYPR